MMSEIIEFLENKEIDIYHFYDSLPEPVQKHCERVAVMTQTLARQAIQAGVYRDEALPALELVERAARYHDIGMAMIPERLLNKVEELTSAERRVIGRHALYGGKLLEKYRKSLGATGSEDVLWRLAADIAASHHERWDGKGYPFGLLATAISPVARAAAIADTYDSIVTGANYRMDLPPEYALLEIMENAGTQFDPQLAELFRENFMMRKNSMSCK